jgi:hypothetical protein
LSASGNPPFEVPIIERFLARSAVILPDMARAGFLLPAYAMQTHRRVVGWLEHWSISVDLIPPRLFPRLRLPLVFVVFTRGARREMVGLALYEESCDVDRVQADQRELLVSGRPRKSVWRAVVDEVMERLGGRAHLTDIYQEIEPRRPTGNNWLAREGSSGPANEL